MKAILKKDTEYPAMPAGTHVDVFPWKYSPHVVIVEATIDGKKISTVIEKCFVEKNES